MVSLAAGRLLVKINFRIASHLFRSQSKNPFRPSETKGASSRGTTPVRQSLRNFAALKVL